MSNVARHHQGTRQGQARLDGVLQYVVCRVSCVKCHVSCEDASLHTDMPLHASQKRGA